MSDKLYVKAFVDGLKEQSEFEQSKYEEIAQNISKSIQKIIPNIQTKEFRDKVNFLKMKLKGSRSQNARLALLN